MDYFVIETDTLTLRHEIEQTEGDALFQLASGTRVEIAEDLLPFRFDAVASDEFQLPAIIDGDFLMRNDLVELILRSGGENLQVFPAEIRLTKTGETLTNYSVFNVIGLVDASDKEQSRSLELADGAVHLSLTLDKDQGRGRSIFRLADSLVDVVVNEQIAMAVTESELFGVILRKVSGDLPGAG